jgi:hypothetical protein
LRKSAVPPTPKRKSLLSLSSQRAQDLQVYAFRAGDQYVTGPLPETTESAGGDELLEAVKRVSIRRPGDD